MKKIRIASLLIAFLLVIGAVVACEGDSETNPIETDAPETETGIPDSETEAPDTDKPETDAPETDEPETEKPEPSEPEPVEVASLVAVADTYVHMGSQEDFGSASKLMIKSADGKSLSRRAFLKFNVPKVASGELEKVTLRLYCQYASDKSGEINARDYKLYAVSSDWNEMGMNWSNQPAVGEKVADIDTSSAKKDTWIEIDVTEYVKAHAGELVAFAIINEGTETEENHINLGSREVEGQEPQLSVAGTCVLEAIPDLPEPDTEEPEPIADTVVPMADTYVQMGSKENFATATVLRVKSADTKSLSRITFLKFYVPKVESGETEKILLRLYCQFASDKPSEIEARDYKLYAVSNDWVETEVNWENRPVVGEKIADVDTASAKKGDWLEVDVTDYVKAHLGEIVAFAIINEGIETEENHINFSSCEVEGQEPQLGFVGTCVLGDKEPPEELFVCNHKAYLTIQRPTATAPGFIMRTCRFCGEILDYEPLAADPTIPQIVMKTVTAKADTHVQAGGKSDTNFGTATDLFVKKDGNNSRAAFFTFDPVNATADEIDSVIFRLRYTYIGDWTSQTKDQDYKLYAVSPDAWDESTLTWNKMLDIESTFAYVMDVETIDANGKKLYAVGDWIEINVTAYMKDYVEKNPGKAISFVLRDEGGDNTEGQTKFASRESGNAPQLVFAGTFVLEPEQPDTPTEPEKPTVNETVTATADAHVQAGGKADTNFGTATDLFVKKDGNNSRAAFFTFDPVNATADEISKVVLRLCYTFSGEYSTYTKNQAYKLYSVSPDSWAESTLTWNKMLEFESSFDFITDVKTIDDDIGKRLYKPGEWIEIDVTEYVKEYMEENSGKALSFVLRDEGGDNANGHSKFASRETENAPQLVFTGTFDLEP